MSKCPECGLKLENRQCPCCGKLWKGRSKRVLSWRYFYLTVLLQVFLVSLAQAQTVVNRYVDTDCANNGDGTVQSPCASGAGLTGPYKTLQDAENDLETDYSANFVTANVQVNLQVEGSTDETVGAVISGITADATRYLRIFPATTDRHAGTLDTSKYLLKKLETALEISMPYTRVENLQIQVGPANDNMQGVYIRAGATGVRLTGNIIWQDKASCSTFCNSLGIRVETDYVGPGYIVNNILYGWDYNSANKVIDTTNLTAGKLYVYNNTIVGYEGIEDGFSDVVAKNNIISATTCVDGSMDGTSNYNSQTCASASGANSRSSQTFTFVNAASGDYHLGSADAGAKNFGVDLSGDANYAFSTDIDGQTRSGSWDIGADEIVSTGTVEEICGNGLDDDATGGDLACPGNDKDWDGYPVGEDCDDTNRYIYPGIWVPDTGGAKKCQTDGTYGSLDTHPVCDSPTGICYYIDAVSGNDTTGDGSYATPWQTQKMFSKVFVGPTPSGHHDPVDGDTFYFMNGNYTTVNTQGTANATKFLEIRENDCTASLPCSIRAYPGHTPVIKDAATTNQTASIYIFESNYWLFEGFEIDGQDISINSGIYVAGPSTGVEIRNNKIHDKVTSTGGNHAGIYVDPDNTDYYVHHNASYDNTQGTGGAGDNQMTLFRSNGRIEYNLFYNNATLGDTSTQCFKWKHADYDSSLAYIGNQHWNCGEIDDDGVGFSGGNLTIKNNLFVNTRRMRFGDLGGASYMHNILIQNNTWKNVNGTPINIVPHRRYNIGSDTYLSTKCSGDASLGTFVIQKNVFENTGSGDMISVGQYDPDTLYTEFITGDLFDAQDNHYYQPSSYTFCLFCSNNADLSCTDAARGSSGATTTGLANWQSLGYDTASTAASITWNTYQSSTAIDTAGRGWLNGLFVNDSSSGSISYGGARVRGKNAPLGHHTR